MCCPYLEMGQDCEKCSLYGFCPETRSDKENIK